ncbi:MAG: GNAT family N-acetyltransferase [Ktedonobacterales bacterium]
MDTHDIAHRILLQRVGRFTDFGPELGPYGSARFRFETGRLRVAYASARPGKTREVVETVQRFARVRHTQVQWVVVPAQAGEEELPGALTAACFERIENLLLMAHEGYLATPLPHLGLAVAPIAQWRDIWDYEYCSRICFYGDIHPSDALVNQRASERWSEHERGWCRYYVARLGGSIIGGCYISLFEDIPMIMGVCTLPEARGRGVATALLAQAVADVISPANPFTCLFVEHGNHAETLYRKLGFIPLLDSQTYSWSPG